MNTSKMLPPQIYELHCPVCNSNYKVSFFQPKSKNIRLKCQKCSVIIDGQKQELVGAVKATTT